MLVVSGDLTLALVKIHDDDVAQVENGAENAKNALLLLRAKSEQRERAAKLLKSLRVVDTLDDCVTALVGEAVRLARVQLQLLQVGAAVARRAQLVKDVVVALARRLEHDARLLQQVGAHAGALDVVPLVEVDLDELAEATAVVVSRCFCVANRLKNIFNSYKDNY